MLDSIQLAAWLGQDSGQRYGQVATPEGVEHRLVRSANESGAEKKAGPDGDFVCSLRAVTAGRDPVVDWWPRPVRSSPHGPLDTFIIVAPDYTDAHAGVVALHRLCDRLNGLGYSAYIHPIGPKAVTRPGWLTPLLRGRALPNAVVVYPEIVTGNLLGVDRVVRWLLNRPGTFTGNAMDAGPHDLVVSFSPQVSAEYPLLNVPLVDPTQFFPKDVPGKGGLLWIGKGVLPDDFERSAAHLVTDRWPPTRERMAQILRSAEVLYTCDWLTTMIDESLLCGTPVVLVGEQDWDRDEILMRPGIIWEGDDLDEARRAVGSYFPSYVKSVASADVAVEKFVELVNVHFTKDSQ